MIRTTQRPNGHVCEITDGLDLTAWPAGSRVRVRRERAHPGAQLSFTDHNGHRFQAILTDQTGEIAAIERDHRARARVEDHIRNDKDMGLRNLPFRDFEHNRGWLEIEPSNSSLVSSDQWTARSHQPIGNRETLSLGPSCRYRRAHDDPTHGGRLELTKFHAPSGRGGDRHAPANTPGIRHVAFAVDDIDAVVASLRARGAELVGEVERYEDSYRLCYVRGPEGIIVELAEQIG